MMIESHRSSIGTRDKRCLTQAPAAINLAAAIAVSCNSVSDNVPCASTAAVLAAMTVAEGILIGEAEGS